MWMKYETATDADLNHRLLELLHGPVVNHWSLSDDETFIYDCGPTGEGFYKIELRDYCNDWNATMPLAIEHGVYYYPSKNGYEGRVVTKQDRDGHYYHQKSNEDKPLRAIVICLIKVLEAKNDAGQK